MTEDIARRQQRLALLREGRNNGRVEGVVWHAGKEVQCATGVNDLVTKQTC